MALLSVQEEVVEQKLLIMPGGPASVWARCLERSCQLSGPYLGWRGSGEGGTSLLGMCPHHGRLGGRLFEGVHQGAAGGKLLLAVL